MPQPESGILIVHYDYPQRRLLQETAKLAGLEPVGAKDFQEGLDLFVLNPNKFALIYGDLRYKQDVQEVTSFAREIRDREEGLKTGARPIVIGLWPEESRLNEGILIEHGVTAILRKAHGSLITFEAIMKTAAHIPGISGRDLRMVIAVNAG